MAQQQIIWTALPNGITASTITAEALQLSVFVSPRLTSDPGQENLGAFPDFLDWPSTLGKLSFQAVFQGGPALSAIVTSTPSSALWKLLFNSQTLVQPYQYNSFSSRYIRSFPVSHVNAFLTSLYQTIATGADPTEFPSLQTLDQLLGNIAYIGSDAYDLEQKNISAIQGYLQKYGAVPSNLSTTPLDFLQVKLFHQPHNKPNAAPLSAQSPFARVPIPVPEFDFHQLISAFGKFPWLLRQLGLIVDMRLSIPQVVTAPLVFPSPTSVAIISEGWTRPANISPTTSCTVDLSNGVFVSNPAPGSDIANGMLQLGNSATFEVVLLDVDGAAIKTVDFAGNVKRTLARTTVGTPANASLPSLRSAGISIAQLDRALSLVSAFKNADQQDSNATAPSSPVSLHTDDITRGFAFDVWNSQTQTWNSLHERVGTYNFLDPNGNTVSTQQVSDEGWIQLAATQAADGSSSDLYVHETIFRWTGWSLAAPRYGMAITNQDTPVSYEPALARTSANSQLSSSGEAQLPALTTSFTPQQGSLPLLRFGMQYRIRARAVDLAGNSMVPAPTDFSSSTAPFIFNRFDPVLGPLVVLRTEVNPQLTPPADETGTQQSPGESLRTLVIRSNVSETAAQYNQNLSSTLQSQSALHNYLDSAVRIIAPPRSSQQMAELHGEFDVVTGGVITGMKGDATTYSAIAQRDSWNFQQYVDVNKQVFPIYPSDDQQVNYLPDPISRGARLSFTDIDGNPIPQLPSQSISFFPTPGAWPAGTTFELELVDAATSGKNPPEYFATFDGKVLTVGVPKAQVVNLTLSSALFAGDLGVLGVWQSITQISPPPPNLGELDALARSGELWMLTPYSELTLVHAVQQPLVVPDMSNPPDPTNAVTPLKYLGDTYAEFIGQTPIDGRSTVKVDVLAQWQEPVDPLSAPGWSYINGTAHPFEIQVNPDDTAVVFGKMGQAGISIITGIRQRHEFGDTKYRHVIYTTVATTRFLEYFPSSVTGNLANVTQTSPAYPLDILSSARPAAPKVLYVVPTFQWNRTAITNNAMDASATTASSTRTGGGLRVYMDRPWWSSGDGEQLGVLLWEGQSIPPDLMVPYVSMFGNDPLWITNLTPGLLVSGDFDLAVSSATNLTLEEVPGYVAVAGHDVGYDTTRQLWYCDIIIDPHEAYNPFVRLALARYQPNSVNTAELSRVVLADFMQLTPNRSVSIVFSSADASSASVSVSGIFPQAPSGLQIVNVGGPPGEVTTAPNTILVVVEQKVGGVADPYLGWVRTQGPPYTVELTETQSSPETWSGTVPLPAPRGSQQMRLVISEYENYPTEGGDGRRVVFTEAVQI